MRNFSIKRFTASLLLIVMLVAAVPATMFNFAIKASAAEDESATIIDAAIFFSDLHTNKSDYKESTLKGVLNSIKNNHSGVTFTSITSGGDAFSVNEDNSYSNGPYTGYTATLNGYINSVFNGIDINYVWSDHDRCAVQEDGTTLLDKTSHLSYGAGGDGRYGTSDDGNYYVYTLSMGDLCSYDRYSAGFNYTLTSNNRVANGFTETVPLAIQQFKDDVAKLHKDRPLFIVSHQPLFNNRKDNAWAEDWCNAINEVAESMDVAFFYGHNHKYDSGSDYYYAKGSTMAVATRKLSNGNDWNYDYQVGSGWQYNNTLASVNKVINFTHMCAGYLAPSSTGSTSGTTREGTALAVTITADSINYVTYSASGKYTGSYAANYTVKRDHAVVTPVVPDATYEDNSGLGISVTAPGITGVNASKVTKAKPEGYAAYITYDINPIGYTSGDTATVVVPVDSSFDPTKPVQVIDGGKVIAVTNIVDGKVTFTTNHFSEYSIAQLSLETSGGNWVTITTPGSGTDDVDPEFEGWVTIIAPKSGTIFRLTDTLEAGKTYVIVNRNTAGNGNAVNLSGNSIASTSVTVIADSNGNYIEAPATTAQWTYTNNDYLQSVSNTSSYLRGRRNTGTLRVGDNRSDYRTWYYNLTYGLYGSNSDYNVNSSFELARRSNSDRVYIYVEETTSSSNGTYGKIDGDTTYNATLGMTADEAMALVKAGIDGYYTEAMSTPGTNVTGTKVDDSELTWEWVDTFNGNVAGDYEVRISYIHNGTKHVLGTAEVVVTTPGLYAMIDGNLSYTLDRGTTAEDALDKVKQGITIMLHNGDPAAAYPCEDDEADWVLDERYDGTTPGEFAVTITYNGIELGVAKVVVPERELLSGNFEGDKKEGTAPRGSEDDVSTGAKLFLTYEGGYSEVVDITVGMLEGNFDINKNGIYTGLAVVYGPYRFENFTLEVTNIPGIDYPEFPDEGAVKVNKTAIYKDEDFRKTGVAQVELSVAGIAQEKGVDVIVMLDLSSSMTRCVTCNNKNCSTAGHGGTRVSEMEEALQVLEDELKKSNNAKNIKVAIADFNGVYTTGPSAYNSDNHVDRTQDVGALTNGANDKIHTWNGVGTRDRLDANAFVSAADLDVSAFTFTPSTGTNYDYAFDAVYQLGYAIKQENIKNNDTDRELFVIFMSDGAANQFNYYNTTGGQSGAEGTSDWDKWLTGNVGEGKDYSFSEIVQCQNHIHYFDETTGNQHRMANAIKGDPDQLYEIIRKNQDKNNPTDAVTGALVELTPEDKNYGKDNMYKLPGLGATTYTLAFYVINDGNIAAESAKHSLKATATDEDHYVDASVSGALAEAFSKIGGQIAYAANNARFVDQMGDTFDIQLSNSVTREVDGKEEKLNFTPTIEVKTYDIWTRNEFLNGTLKDESQIGVRKGTTATLEVVTFNAKGTEAYSDQLGSGNILVDNVINAKTFVYNNNKDGTYVNIDTDGDGVNDYSLAPETFYWKVGTVMEKELAISYYVYLTDTLEGERQSGSYATNNFAILYYDNYLGNECEMHTVSPMLAWKEANVSYAFYLVDSNGRVIVNRNTGLTGNFADKIAVTRPKIFDTCKLNTSTDLAAITIAETEGILPEGYEIYDVAASYSIIVLSNTQDKTIGWEIGKGADKVASTYVTGFSNTVQYSNTTSVHTTNAGYDYTHTTVWFAVVWKPSTISDQVVIDYGLPVDISVLENDLFKMSDAALSGVGISKPAGITANNGYAAAPATGFGSLVNLTFGSAQIRDKKVRYTPANMKMNSYDKFVYEVKYTTDQGDQYYYGDVTVIPATNIYYEENFVEFVPANPNNGAYGVWVNEGTAVAGVQDEDRPGKDSLGTIDHDNVYGHDEAYKSYKEFSLGAAKKVSVNSEVGYHKDNSPTAKFTFTGTGFDIISMTNSDSGVIFISVYKTGTTTAVSNKFVDNYYGYTYTEENGWTPAPNPHAAIYQVPVMKFAGLPYDTYDVVIWVTYSDYFDHDIAGTNGTPGYSFWLDSIRIYNPAGTDFGNDSVIGDAYGKDNESNPLYLEIGDAIVPSKTNIPEGTKLPGVVFIDGKQSTNSAADYAGPGPNNEVYLYPDQAIAFKLSSNATPLDVQIGVKLAFGETADVQFTYSANGKSESRTRTFTTATDMYYSIASYLHFVPDNQQSETPVTWESGTITLMNVSGSVISLTNIKATFKNAGYVINGTPDTPAEISFVTDAEVIENAAAVVTKFFASKPKPVLEVFDPETLAYTVVSGIRGINTVRVITSNDADAITVNGIEAKKTDDSKIIKSMVKMLDKLYGDKHNAEDYCVWTVEVKSAPVYDIVAFRIVEIPDSSIDTPVTFEPETVAHTVISNINGTNTVRVITSKDVSSIIVNGVKAEKINDAKILKSMVKMLDKLYDDKHNESDYYVWTVDVKSAASYDIVAFNEDGVSTIPAIENTKNGSNK